MWASYYTYQGTGSVTEAMKVGAVSYATSWALQGVNAYYGNTWTVGRVAIEGAIGGAAAKALGGSFSDGFAIGAGMSLLNWGAYEMRRSMVAQSKRNEFGLNSSGSSDGMYGDNFKLAGGRASGEATSLNFDASPLGGRQGGLGEIVGRAYRQGSFADHLLEAYAGPHDWLSSFAYTAQGNIRTMSALQSGLFTVYSGIALFPATAFAAAPFVPTSSVLQIRRGP